MDRRDFILHSSLAGAGLLVGASASNVFAQGARTPGATVQTTAGRLRGFVDNGVQTFRGIPYGASTAGPNRFMPPQKLQAWTGVRDAFEYGGRAPQFVGGEPTEMLSTDPREA